MRVLIFGTGKFYQNRKERVREVLEDDEVLAFLDNHRTGIFEGKPVYAPKDGIRLPFDRILLMSSACRMNGSPSGMNSLHGRRAGN